MASLMSAEEMMSRIVQLEVDSSITKAELIDILKQFEVQKEAMQNAIQREFAQTRNRIDILVNDVRAEVKILNEKREDLLNQTARAVDQLDSRLIFFGGSWRLRGRRRQRRPGRSPKRISTSQEYNS